MNEHATPAVTPSALRGRGIGIVVCAIFAALWANWARPWLMGAPASWAWAAAIVVAVISGALLLVGVSMIRGGRRLSKATGVGDMAPRPMRRGFTLVLIAEIVALNIAAYFLIGHHMAQYLAPVIAVIVGLHFLPLAQIFRAPHFFATAVVMTLAGVVAAAAMATGSPGVAANGIVDLACAVALWGTGFVTWRRVHNATVGSAGPATTSPAS
ncbi:MAG TPA: hypothetical protein VJL61_05345 [Rhodanobacteraceae bacterium]|nr:hypothetical protein [Rhodanobacteraceae bacterium]